MMPSQETIRHAFKPRARLLLLLGDQLIRDAGLAVFELVKNAYDADATTCIVSLLDFDKPQSASIVVEDDGMGMDIHTVTGVWLEPGTDFRSKQRFNRERSPKYNRLPLGEKGVGRFAVHKLGAQIEVVTRSQNEPEIVVSIDWTRFDQEKYLSQIPVSVITRSPVVFKGRKTGTRIEITRLRDEKWTRGKVRDLNRSIMSICSPFEQHDNFEARLRVVPQSDWLEGLLDVKTVLENSLFNASVAINGNSLDYEYAFTPPVGLDRHVAGREARCPSTVILRSFETKKEIDLGSHEIGPVRLDIHIFDREPKMLDLATSDKAGLKKFLDQNGGVRVYRDGVRVFDFGEPGNDWLDLGGRRVNIPTVRVSNNQVIGAVSLIGGESGDLVEKTNREGFIENDAYQVFRDAVLFAITQVEAERKKDKMRLRNALKSQKFHEPVLDDLAELRDEIEKQGLEKELGRYVNRIETQFVQVRDTLLTAAGAGLTLTTVIHEVEKIIKELVQALKANASRDKVTGLVQHLSQMVDGLGFLMKKSGRKTETASVLIKQALFNTEYRLKAHNIRAWNGIEEADPDFSVKCVRRLVVSTLTNLIDNAIYWLENKGAKQKDIYLGTTFELNDKPALVIADNGPGLADPPEYLIEPFFSRKPDGMGLGLHLASEVAKVHGGRLVFPENGDVTLPDAFTGAVIAIEFPGES